MIKTPKWLERLTAGGIAASIIGAGTNVADHLFNHYGDAGKPGAVMDLNENNGMLVRDISGKPAFSNYFKSDDPSDMRISISIATDEEIPENFTNKWGQLTKLRQKNISSRLPSEDFRPISPQLAEVIEDTYAQITKFTNIKFDVQHNNNDADIIVGGYATDTTITGFASFPQELLKGLTRKKDEQGFLILNAAEMDRRIDSGNKDGAMHTIAHEIGHNLGILHPFDRHVDTALTDHQQEAISTMAYTSSTQNSIASTDIKSGYGALDINILRKAVVELGGEVPKLNEENNTYSLGQLAEDQQKDTKSTFGGSVYSLPAATVVDNGGATNTLTGTSGDDLLVTEAGDCGLINRNDKKARIERDGQAYCLVEGEFSIIKSGSGDDLIITAANEEQTVYTRTGKQDVAVFETGDLTLSASPRIEAYEDKNIAQQLTSLFADPVTAGGNRGKEDLTSITLHHSLFQDADAMAHEEGNDIKINFTAESGRDTGSITIKNQTLDLQGVDQLRVINDEGDVISQIDSFDYKTAEQWNSDVLAPTQQAVLAYQHQLDASEQDRDSEDTVRGAMQKYVGAQGVWTRVPTNNGNSHTAESGAPPIKKDADAVNELPFATRITRQKNEERNGSTVSI
ncbi:MAG: hypothetical protein MK052_03465 [Alphaproteobacteria bacterium]|nr:hypothetical protein [Alphaproteobacteria bacterium]